MKVHYGGFVHQPISPAKEILDAAALVRHRNESVKLLGYTPVAKVNPYQALIYKEFWNSGIAVAPVLKPVTFRDLAIYKDMASSTTLHLHWNSWMTYNEVDPIRARTLGLGIIGRLEKMKEEGVSIMWTVHNLYPHDAKHIDLELEIQQRIADLADIVHIMSKSTIDVMEGLLAMDKEKILVSPHPNYIGAYPDYMAPLEARATLGLGADEVVFLLFGAIKPYKGLDRLLKSFDRVCSDNPETRFRLIVAGEPDKSAEAADFVDRCLCHPRVLIEPARISSDRAQIFLRASDVGLANYDRMLNSGAARLYQTFGLPIVAADIPPLREGLAPAGSIFVSGPSVEEFATALGESAEMAGNEAIREEVMQHALQFDSTRLSRELADELTRRIERNFAFDESNLV